MTTLHPTAPQMVTALRDHGVPIRLARGYSTRGAEWRPGLLGAVVHHTSTASATGSTGAPTLDWVIDATSRGACNLLVGRGRDDVWLIIGNGSAFHTGDGGPWTPPGSGHTFAEGNTAHWGLFGIEIDDPGVSRTITDTQFEMTGRVLASLMDLCGWGTNRIIRHEDWTNFGRYEGRKNDTLARYYPTSFWREQASKYVKGAHPTPSTPAPSQPSTPHPPASGGSHTYRQGKKVYRSKMKYRQADSDSVWNLQVALLAKGYSIPAGPTEFYGDQTKAAVAKFQRDQGWSGSDADGIAGRQSIQRLGLVWVAD